MTALAQLPAEFAAALRSMRGAADASRPSGLRLEEIPAPARLAPYAVALEAEICEGEEELAKGRFILLYDPEPPAVWEGTFRVVTYIRAQLEPEMGNDALLGSVAWTWLVESLEKHHADCVASGGTATRVLSESYGTLAGRPDTIDIELRASWTPTGPELSSHLDAWCDMVATFAGVPPLPAGVAVLPRRRRGQETR